MSDVNITYSSELMKNYLHAEVVSAQAKFEALQTNDGHSLLFAIDTSGVLNVLTESSGTSAAGWSRTDLSSARIHQDFASDPSAVCRTFEAGQSAADGTLSLAMVASAKDGDHLYLSLGNSNTDIAWTAAPNWQPYAFDSMNATPVRIAIVNVFLCESSDGVQYTVVDILRDADPNAASKDIRRYYIDPAKEGGYGWHQHDLPVDIEADGYSSCTGRLPNGMVDGIYTSGKAGNKGQLVFTPVINVFGTAPPMPTRLDMPGDAILDAIAATRNADQSTDLYVTSGTTLFYFDSTAQVDGAQPVRLFDHPLLLNVQRLFAHKTIGQVYLWGLNRDDQVFYLTCADDAVTTPSAWSHPVPILSEVALVSPYVNRVNYGNTLFGVRGQTLFRMTQSPQTGLWSTQSLTLPAPAASAAPHGFSSYTTRILATEGANRAVPGAALQLSALTRGAFFINNLYYVLDTAPITVECDSLGSLTIIESVDNTIHGTKLTVSLSGGQPVSINPMDNPMQKLARLDSVTALQAAIVTGADGATRPLVNPSTSTDDLKTVADANTKLMAAYRSAGTAPALRRLLAPGARHMALQAHSLSNFPESIAVDAGDLFSWLETGVESVVQVVEDTVTGAWHFIARIAGAVYQGVLDTVEAVVGAVKWVFNAIKTAIEDLIQFLEFLFAWKDILTTHDVMKQVFKLQVREAIDALSGEKTDIKAAFGEAQQATNGWASIPEFGGSAGGQGGQDDYGTRQSAPANLGLHHYQGNAGSAVMAYAPPAPGEAVFDDLLKLLEAEGTTLAGAYAAVKTDIIDQFDSLSATEIVKRFAAILTDTLLQSAENIVCAAIDVFVQLAGGFLEMLDASLDIPVLSWLYKELTGNDLSMLDLVCLIAAIPATLMHKAVCDRPPFPRGDGFTDALLGAQSFLDVRNAFHAAPSALAMREARMTVGDATPVLDESRLKVFGFVSGLFAAAGSVVLIVATGIQRTLDATDLEAESPRSLAGLVCMGNIAYVSPNIATIVNVRADNWYQELNNSLTGISVLKGFAGILFPTSASPVVKYGFPAVESLINLVWNIPVAMNIIDNKDHWNSTYKSLIPESIGDFAFNLGGMLELPITLEKDPVSKLATVGLQYSLMLVYGLFMPIAGGIYEFDAGQDHGGG